VSTFPHDGFDIFYDRSGEGPRLLFCNGSGASIATTGPLLDGFRRHFDVAVHDQRGLGGTGLRQFETAADDKHSLGGTGLRQFETAADDKHSLGRTGLRQFETAAHERWEMADYAADALALADHLGWERFALAGMSFGGMVAQELAVTAPDRVSRLALLCTSSGGDGGSSFPLHTLEARPLDEQRDLALRLTDGRFTPAWLDDHPTDRLLVNQRRLGHAPPQSDSERRGEFLQLDARSRHDVWDRLSRITCPTFVASGRYDVMAPPDNGAAIASRVGQAAFKIYEGGHAFFAQDPQARRDVRAFLAG
jgi:3-oxoadipate enol-lactonase